jgi:hypothetical protein
VTLIFELAGRTLPDWTAHEYPGHPLVVEGGRRRAVLLVSYLFLPLALVAIGFALTLDRRRRP